MNIFGIILNVLGIGKTALENKQKLNQIKVEGAHEIEKARVNAEVNRIVSNSASDNEIDLETVRQMDSTWKDDILTYLFLVPVFVASIVPFILAYKTSTWDLLNKYVLDSYTSLNALPEWYKWILGLVVIATLGFRSLLRKAIDKWVDKI